MKIELKYAHNIIIHLQQAPTKHGNSPVAEISPISSQTSSPDSQRRSSRHDSIASTGSSTTTPQTQFLQKQKELREQQMQQQHLQQTAAAVMASPPPAPSAVNSLSAQSHVQISNQSSTVYSPDKPPIPPRGNPPPVPQRQISSSTNESVQLRRRSGKRRDKCIGFSWAYTRNISISRSKQ